MMEKLKSNRGITLVEVLVATALFSIVMVISVGSIVSINDSNKKSQLSRTVMDNLNFAMENMARNLRVGTVYHCGNSGTLTSALNCSNPQNGDNFIAFEGYRGSSGNLNDQIIYRLHSQRIERSVDSGQNYLPITSPELIIDSLTFYVTGTGTDQKQPRVVILISGSATFKTTTANFKVQTAVSQRRLDS